MRYHVSRFLMFVSACLAVPAIVSAQSIHLPRHEKVVMKNGMTVLLMEKHGVPMVSFSAILKSGATADPVGQEGLASITAGLLRKGTKTRTAQQFAADLDFIGGYFGADAGEESTSVSAEFLTKDLARGLDLYADAFQHPTFPQGEVDKLIAQAIDSAKGAKDAPDQVLAPYYNGYLFGAVSYGRPTGGDELSLKHIHREDVTKFYETYYAPGNIILAVAGEFNTAEMNKKLEEVFGTWTAKAIPAVAVAPASPVEGRRLLLVDKPDATQTYFAIGNIGTTANDPDRVAIRVVNTIFGGRFTSMLNEALRVESGLTYGVNSSFEPHKTPGAFGIYSFTKNATTVQAVDMALAILQKLHKDGVTPEQLASAKSYIKGQFPPSIETSGQLARRIAQNEFYGLDDSEVNQLEARIDAVTPELARHVIQKRFPLDSLVFVMIGKAAEIKPEVQKYAEKQDARAITEPGYWPHVTEKK